MIRKAVAAILVMGMFISMQAQETALQSFRGDTHISFYPNPVSEILYIAVGDVNWESSFQIELIDPIGREIEEIILDRVGIIDLELNVSSRPPGMYFLRVIIDGVSIETHRININ